MAKNPLSLLKLNLKSLKPVKQLHQQVITCGSHHNTGIITKLTQFYADSDDLNSAHKMLDEMPQPNVFTYTAILGFFSRHGMHDRCVLSYGSMNFYGVFPDNYVFPKVLRACAQLSWSRIGKLVHKDVVVFGFQFNLHVCNALIDMYAKCGDLMRARWVFDRMVERDLMTWNLVISGYVSNGLMDVALELGADLRLDGNLKPDVVTWNTLMDAFCRMGLCDEALKVFESIEEPNIISWTTLISGFSRTGEHGTSLRIFKDMVSRGRIFPDVDCLSSVIVSCRHLGELMIGREIQCYGVKMQDRARFYGSCGPALLTLYARCGRIGDARNMFALMDKYDVVTWNAMILSFVELEMEGSALECLVEMQRLGIENNQTTWSTILPACSLKHGKKVHAYLLKSKFFFVVPVWNAVIHMYCKFGSIRYALSVFSSMPSKDLVSWNTIIGGFGMHGQGQAAIQFLQDLRRSGLCPNSMTFTSLLSACSHSGIIDTGLDLFHSMTKEYGLSPTMKHYSCVVDMLSRAGRLSDAVNFINQMPIEPDKSIWGSLLAACRDHQNVKLGKLAAEKLIRFEAECAGHYVTLSDIYARAGRWNDSIGTRKQMECVGLVKPSGQSWIEHG